MRLMIVVEGQTEEAFVKEVLAPHLVEHGVYARATIVGKRVAQKRALRHRGGGYFRHWKDDICRLLAGDRGRELRVTTLFDLYGLPPDFPGLSQHHSDADALETALAAEIDDRRFIPYLQRHEFEALVLASLPSLRRLLDAEDDLTGLDQLASAVSGAAPEDINDGPTTAPSKRLAVNVPGYSKTLHGPLATHDTGLPALRQQCPRFDSWVSRLETLGEVP